MVELRTGEEVRLSSICFVVEEIFGDELLFELFETVTVMLPLDFYVGFNHLGYGTLDVGLVALSPLGGSSPATVDITMAAAALPPQQLMDLVFAVGQYTLVSMALNSFGVQLDPGVEGFPG